MSRLPCVLFMVVCGGFAAVRSAAEPMALPPWFSPGLYLSGRWTSEDSLVNRADLRFRVHFENISPLLDFSLRAQVVDSRKADDLSEAVSTVPTAGLYHTPTASRVLYGPLLIKGLPARVRSIWQRGAPFILSREAVSADLRTEPVQSAVPAFYACLETPSLYGFSAFSAVTRPVDEEAGSTSPLGFAAGADMRFTKKTSVSTAFYRQTLTLEERKAGGWFSEKTALPERDSRLTAGTFLFKSPYLGLAGDAAYSETFAFGRGLYWNAALQAGSRPLRLSLAADMSSPRFVDGLGAVPGAGFRAWARAEWLRPRGELWRFQTALRGFGAEQDGFTRSSSSIYYRFPAAKNTGVSFSRVSLSAARNADDGDKILDGWDALIGLNFGKVRTTWTFALDEYTKDDTPIPFPDPTNVYVLQEWKLAAEAAFSVLFCTVTAKTGMVKKLDAGSAEWNDAEIPFSVSLQMRGGPGRLTLKASSAHLPSDWTAGISWRLRLP